MFHALTVLLTSSMAIAAPQWSCGTESWIRPPKTENGMFRGALAADCVLEQTTGKGFEALKEHLIAKTMLGVVHEGPIEENFADLPSIRYDVTEDLSKKSSIRVRALIHIATDLSTRLVYSGVSSGVEASGVAGYLKGLNITMDVRVRDAQSFTVRITSAFAIARPWYMPGGIFTDQATKTALEKFKKSEKGVVTDIGNNL